MDDLFNQRTSKQSNTFAELYVLFLCFQIENRKFKHETMAISLVGRIGTWNVEKLQTGRKETRRKEKNEGKGKNGGRTKGRKQR